MLRSIAVTSVALLIVLIGAAASMIAPIYSQQAAAQSTPLYVYVVDLDIVAAEFDKFMEALKENAAASMQDPGCREFDVAVSQKDPHHVLLFEVYDNAAALRAHEATEHYKKYSMITANMVLERDTRVFASAVMNKKGI
jgi:(4S)-4-hydroxy-5-phosphonooxypentane-2,3-dione isomerase